MAKDIVGEGFGKNLSTNDKTSKSIAIFYAVATIPALVIVFSLEVGIAYAPQTGVNYILSYLFLSLPVSTLSAFIIGLVCSSGKPSREKILIRKVFFWLPIIIASVSLLSFIVSFEDI